MEPLPASRWVLGEGVRGWRGWRCLRRVAWQLPPLCPCRKLKAWHQKRELARVRGGQIRQEPSCWEEDFELIPCEGLFEEYLEMGRGAEGAGVGPALCHWGWAGGRRLGQCRKCPVLLRDGCCSGWGGREGLCSEPDTWSLRAPCHHFIIRVVVRWACLARWLCRVQLGSVTVP